MEKNFMTILETAKKLLVPEGALRRLKAADQLPGFHSRNRYYVNVPRLERQLGIGNDSGGG